MITIDTNVLLRFIVCDDEAQAVIAARTLESLTSEAPGFVCRESILEIAWTLRRAYRFTRQQTAEVLLDLAQGQNLIVEERDVLLRAIERYAAGGPELADILIEAAGRRAGSREMVTFDKRAAQLDGVRLLGG